MASDSRLPASVSGFTVLPVLYSSSTHIIYARPHVGSKKAKQGSQALPDGRTLFLVNIPPDATEREFILFFRNCGTVERVIFDCNAGEQVDDISSDSEGEQAEDDDRGNDKPSETTSERQPRRKKRKFSKSKPPKVVPLPQRQLRTLRKTGRTAHIVFLDSSSVERALSNQPRPWPTSAEEPSGLAHYVSLYESLRPPLDAVRDFADSSMALYEYELAKNKQKSKYRKGEAIVDEDGFTLVTRGGAYGQTLGGGVRIASKKFQEDSRSRAKKANEEKAGFYAFQRAEKQRKELIELKKKWEEDKARIEKLKESRQFKPY